MKKLFIFFIALAIFSSCRKEKISTPSADYEYFVLRNTDTVFSPDTVEVGEVVYFRNIGSGNYFSVYPGETGSCSYSAQTDSLFPGAVVNRVSDKGAGWALRRAGLYYSVGYTYKNQGTYEIVYVATSTANYAQDTRKSVNRGKFIAVSDRRTKLSDFFITIGAAKTDVKPKFSSTGDTVFLPVRYGWTDKVATIKFQAGNASVTRNGIPVAKEGVSFRDRNVDVSNPITYTVTAADGVTVKSYVFMLKEGDKSISNDNTLKSISVSGVAFTIGANSVYNLAYPNGKTDAAVVFGVESYAKIKVNNKTYGAKDLIKISDLTGGTGTVEVISESGMSATYKYVLTEETLVAEPFAFSNATGFPVVKGTGDTLNVYLSSSLDFAKLVPVFPASKFTVIKYGADLKTLVNGATEVDFTNPVPFTFTNGIQAKQLVLVIKAL